MEELQDAIEDAQYMNAMHDDVPKPTKVCLISSRKTCSDSLKSQVPMKEPHFSNIA